MRCFATLAIAALVAAVAVQAAPAPEDVAVAADTDVPAGTEVSTDGQNYTVCIQQATDEFDRGCFVLNKVICETADAKFASLCEQFFSTTA
ncbi:hypothetical protein H4R33_005576 [Dimargaris cristalligena]|nr:hypothetical protein H4R33_005576 [Dimargaris cristalligena]